MMKLIGKGAEAHIFSTKILGKNAIVKMRKPKSYRVKEFDLSLRRRRTKREAKAMYRAGKVGVNTPRIYALGRFDIYMERLNGQLLKDAKVGTKVYRTTGGMLAAMHKADIAHGDFTPANIMVNGEKMWIIDFGLSEITKSVEEKALDLLLMKRAISAKYYKAFINEYKKEYPDSKTTISRLAEIEKRGRYQKRTLI